MVAAGSQRDCPFRLAGVVSAPTGGLGVPFDMDPHDTELVELKTFSFSTRSGQTVAPASGHGTQ